jgi:hypothetical protein
VPDLRCCVKHNGKTYCWDFEQRKVVEVVVRDVPLTPEVMGIIGDIVALVTGAADSGVPGGKGV